MYKAIVSFTDLQDDFYRYEIGDAYPREGLSVSDTRIAELAGSNNKQKKPVIVMVEIEEEPKKRGRKKKDVE